MGSVPLQLAELFGLVVQCRETSSNHSLLSMTVHTPRQAMSPGEPLYPACMQFTTQDYKEVSQKEVLSFSSNYSDRHCNSLLRKHLLSYNIDFLYEGSSFNCNISQ